MGKQVLAYLCLLAGVLLFAASGESSDTSDRVLLMALGGWNIWLFVATNFYNEG